MSITVLITIAPVFFTAAIYVMIYQIAMYVSESSSRFRPRLFYWIYISADIFALVLQAIGGGMSATSDGSDTGEDLALAGLIFQVIVLVFFAFTVLDYAYLSRRVWMAVKLPRMFLAFCVALTFAWVFILIRCCYRVYELAGGYSQDNDALTDQPLFIGLEGVYVWAFSLLLVLLLGLVAFTDWINSMIILAAICLVIAHPGFAFKGKSLTEIAEQKSEKRANVDASGEESA
jgi:hypothetical protein